MRGKLSSVYVLLFLFMLRQLNRIEQSPSKRQVTSQNLVRSATSRIDMIRPHRIEWLIVLITKPTLVNQVSRMTTCQVYWDEFHCKNSSTEESQLRQISVCLKSRRGWSVTNTFHHPNMYLGYISGWHMSSQCCFLMVTKALRNKGFFRDTSTHLYFVHRVFSLSGQTDLRCLSKGISFGLAY